MDDTFLYDENENIDKDYINENNIIHRQPNIVECEDNRQGIYSIEKLLKKDVVRENILLSNIDINDNYKSHDSKTIIFDLSLNKLGGVNYKKNVIGFRLNECIYTSPVYNITDNNNKINVIITIDHYITIPNGYYTIQALVDYINNPTTKFNDNDAALISNYFSASYSCTECKVTITSIANITFSAIDSNPLLYNLGFRFDGTKNLPILPLPTSYTAETHPSLNTGAYIDIVVDEIPYGACKQNPSGLNIIHRLPITTSTNTQTIGPIVHYKSGYFNNDNQYLFPPMNLSQLTVNLYMDGNELPLDNLTISFEFELTLLNK